MKKGRIRATQDICDDSRSMFTANGRFCTKGRRGVLSFAFVTETKHPRQKTVRISHNQIRPRSNLYTFSSSLYARHTSGNPCHCSQTLVHPQPHSRLKAWQLSMDYSGVRMNVSGPAEGNLLFLLLKGEKQGRKISHLFLNNK